MYPDWNAELGAPTVDDRIVNAFELTIDVPPSHNKKITLLVEPANGGTVMSERGLSVATILQRTHDATVSFLNSIINFNPNLSDVPSLRVDLKNLLENHRSALEYVAHYMAERCRPVPKPHLVKFPIATPHENEIDFLKNLKRWFPGLESSHPALVKYLIEVQPFNSDRWLRKLSDWTNYNKHHSLSVWEVAAFESSVMRIGNSGLRIGELGFASIDLTETGKIIFRLHDKSLAAIHGPCKLDMNLTGNLNCDPRIIIEKQQMHLHRIRGEERSIAHEVWTISKNVFRTIHTICYHLCSRK